MSAGFSLGPSNVAIGCKAAAVDTAKTNSSGFLCTGTNAKMIGCISEQFAVGFRLEATMCAVSFSHIKSCGQTAYVSANFSGLAFCTGESNTSGFVSTDASTAVLNVGNVSGATNPDTTNDHVGNWLSNRTPTASREVLINTSSGSTTPTPVINGIQDKVCVFTYSGTAATTIQNPTYPGGGAVNSDIDGKEIVIILQAASGTTLQVAFGSAFIGAATTNVTTNTFRMQRFVYNSTQGKWIARDTGFTVAGTYWP